MPLPAPLLEFGRPGSAELVIVQGDTWSQPIELLFQGDPIGLTGLTATLQFRATFTGSPLLSATCTIPTPANGIVVAALTAAQTAAITVPADVPNTQREFVWAFWDLNLVEGTQVATPVGGIARVWREVTKP
jgi:hypothetical protein